MMEKRQYYFAGIGIELEMPKERFFENEYRLAPFRTEKLVDPHQIRFLWVKELSKPDGNLMGVFVTTHIYDNNHEQIRYLNVQSEDYRSGDVRISHKEKKHIVEVKENPLSEKMSLSTALECMSIEHLIVQENGCLLHCSYIEVNGEAILFTAPSGTGKSTQAELWKNLRDAEIINGDRAAIRVDSEGILAEGLPFAGSSSYCKNRSLPIKAIVYLAQAPVTSIRRMQGYEAFTALWRECSLNTWDVRDVEKVSALVMHVVKNIPIFHLSCTPDETAILALEKALKESEGI